jgi:hypothetical protein
MTTTEDPVDPIEEATCRICLEPGGNMIQPCNCCGSTANVHKDCLVKWLEVSQRRDCEICHFEYIIIIKKPKYFYFFADTKSMGNLVLFVGICLMIPISPLGFYIGLTVIDTYFTANMLWVISTLSVMRRVQIMPTVTYWKLCLSLGGTIVSWQSRFWNFIFFDYGICLLFLLATCVCNKNRDINSEETS